MDINLDRMNISVLSVEGVDFVTYIKILDAMDIEWTMRTDNDILKVPKKNEYRYAGIERGIACWDASEGCYFEKENEERIFNEKKRLLRFEDINNIPTESKEAAQWMIAFLSRYCIEIADVDLETDLYESDLRSDLRDYYYEGDPIDDAAVIAKMKDHKAIRMYGFLKAKKDKLVKLKDDKLAEPLTTAVYNIERIYGAYSDSE